MRVLRHVTPIGLVLLSACGLGPIVDIGRGQLDGGVSGGAVDAAASGQDAGSTLRDSGPFERRLADLLVEEIGPVPSALAPDDLIEVSLTILNRGTKSSRETIAPIRLEPVDGPTGFEIGLINVPPIAFGERLERARVLPLPSVLRAGVYRVVIEVDPDDRVEEANETNNIKRSRPIAYSDLALVPSSFDFGVVGRGCRAEMSARLENRGPARRFVASAVLSAGTDPSFGVSGPNIPVGIDPGDAIEFVFRYEPTEIQTSAGAFVLQHSQLFQPTSYPLRGSSADNPRRVETLKQLEKPQVDILFVIDDSASMTEERDELARGARSFFSFIQAQGIDYQIAVTTTDVSTNGPRGVFVGSPSIIRRNTPNGASVFENSVRVGAAGAASEQGLEAARLAFSPPAIDGPNKGFLRDEASLAIVFVSDEDDSSPDSVDDYARFFEALQFPEGNARFVANAVVGPPEGCATAQPGDRYAELASRTAGQSESICVFNWSNALRNFPGAGFGYQHAFLLQRAPTAGSMQVFVNGIELERVDPVGQRENWYLIEGPTLVFDALAVPEPGATIVVRYETEC